MPIPELTENDAAERAGARVYENTVIDHVEEGPVHALRTRDGHVVRAKLLVLACNAFAPNLGFFANSILPLREYVGITRPLSDDELTALGWRFRAPFSDMRTEVYYFGLSRDGRVHIGGGAPQYGFNNAPAAPRLPWGAPASTAMFSTASATAATVST